MRKLTALPIPLVTSRINYSDYYTTLDTGVYAIEAYQVFSGIPLLSSGGDGGNERYFPWLSLTMSIIDENTYYFEETTVNKIGTICDAVPLLPWRDIQKTFEEQCLANNLMYDVCSVHLGYQLCITHEDKNTAIAGTNGDRKTYPEGTFEEIYTVHPAWLIYGFRPHKTAGMLLNEQTEQQNASYENQAASIERLFQSWSSPIVINAQTGEYIDYDHAPWEMPSVSQPALQWKDVQ